MAVTSFVTQFIVSLYVRPIICKINVVIPGLLIVWMSGFIARP